MIISILPCATDPYDDWPDTLEIVEAARNRLSANVRRQPISRCRNDPRQNLAFTRFHFPFAFSPSSRDLATTIFNR
jgi:hypothetical protein